MVFYDAMLNTKRIALMQFVVGSWSHHDHGLSIAPCNVGHDSLLAEIRSRPRCCIYLHTTYN